VVETEAAPARAAARVAAPPVVHVDGVRLHALDEAGTIRHVIDALEGGRGGIMVTHNLDHLRRLRTDPEFRRICDGADLRVADGMPVVWAAALRGTPLPARVAGSSLMEPLAGAAAAAGKSVFLLGGMPGTADAAADELRRLHPSLRVAGTACPPVGFERDAEYVAGLRRQLADSGADIVFVALGSPKQEVLADAHHDVLPRAWWIGVGISFSFLCGDVQRAPRWMQRAGLEWVHRLAQEPRRLARRYLVDGVPYALRLMLRSAGERGRRPANDSA
jgi:N-acetylglucosaminyldiphosphoundecaprenol N-acetyl-beta-D-mannosaminyltransferase